MVGVPGILGNNNTQGLVDISLIYNTGNLKVTPIQDTFSVSISQISLNKPLAYNIGLLSLANSKEPKYLSLSSNISFARLIFTIVSLLQSLATYQASLGYLYICYNSVLAQPLLVLSAYNTNFYYFTKTYYETYQPLYPFIEEGTISNKVEVLLTQNLLLDAAPIGDEKLSSLNLSQVLLILTLRAKTLKSRLTTNFLSKAYYIATIQYLYTISLHNSLQGIQILLLLILARFYFKNKLNIQFLTSTIITSYLDLSLQRKSNNRARNNLYSSIFQSAYSLDQALTIILGCPLILYNKAINIKFPGSAPIKDPKKNYSLNIDFIPRGNNKHLCLSSRQIGSNIYIAACYSFQFNQIIAKIKLILYYIAQLLSCFLQPTNISAQQRDTYKLYNRLLDSLTRNLK